MAWTAPRTWVTGDLVTAALMQAQVSDNFTFIAQFVKSNIAVQYNAGIIAESGTSYSQIGSLACTLTTIDSTDEDTAVFLFANLQTVGGNTMSIQWYNNTASAVPSIHAPEQTFTAGPMSVIGVDRPETGATTYHLRGKVDAGSNNNTLISMFAMEFSR